MNVDRRKALLFGSAAALRLFLFITFPSLPDVLTGRVELSTPVTSFKRLQEGLFLYNRNVSPFDGGVYHQAPLLLPLFSLLPKIPAFPMAITNLFYIATDLQAAHALMGIADTGAAFSSSTFVSSRKDLRRDSVTIGAGYLFNPFIILSCLARPTSVVSNALILEATRRAALGHSITLILAIALAAYMALSPVLLVPPLLMLCYHAQARRGTTKSVNGKTVSSETQSSGSLQPPPNAPAKLTFIAIHISGFILATSSLLFISRLLIGSWYFLSAHYMHIILLPSLTPNVGLWWYFFTEMFDSFRSFFLGVFWIHMAAYMPAFCLRLRAQPLFIVCAVLGVTTVYGPYPTAGDAGLFLSFLGMFRHIFPLMRYTFPAAASLLYSTLLGPAFYHLWVYAGSGNANFFYAITLVWSLGLTVILADALYAAMRDEYEVERPDMIGKEIRRI